jgi:hypothetical protein
MADIKLKIGTPIFKPGMSEEEKAEVMKAAEAYLVGAEQKMKGEGRAEAIEKFVALLDSLNPATMPRLEEEFRNLHAIEKFQRFRTQLFLILLDVFQGGMHFACSKKAIDNEWDLLRVLGLPQESTKESE